MIFLYNSVDNLQMMMLDLYSHDGRLRHLLVSFWCIMIQLSDDYYHFKKISVF